jgi:hypothetical protein
VTLRICLDCTTAFAVGVPRCPHCGSERHAEQGSAAALGVHASTSFEEDHMPKITRHGGPSFREDAGTGVPMRAVDGDEVTGDGSGRALPPVEEEGGEQPSAGTSTETSSAKPSTKPEPSGNAPRKRARKTANRSAQDRTGISSAPSTDGDQADGTSATDDSADA